MYIKILLEKNIYKFWNIFLYFGLKNLIEKKGKKEF